MAAFDGNAIKEVKAGNSEPSRPEAENDYKAQSGKVVTWDYITFGQYPQTELVTREMSEYYQSVDAQGFEVTDLIVDTEIYHELQNPDIWDENNKTYMDGAITESNRQRL